MIERLKHQLEMTLIALANQKFVDEIPCNGDAMAEGECYRDIQKETQDAIDKIYVQGWDLLDEIKKTEE